MALEKFGIRTIVTFLFGPFILYAAWRGGPLFLALWTSLTVFGLYEFYGLAVHKLSLPVKTIGIGTGIIMCFMFYFNLVQQFWILFSVVFLLVLLFELFRNRENPILNVAATLMGLLYVPFLLGFLILIREMPGDLEINYTIGGFWLILIFLSVWICDSAAYIFGARFGEKKLFARVSPGKTVVGTGFGFGFAILTAFLFHLFFLKDVDLLHVLVVGALCGSVGQVSDLTESLFKRDAGVKDSSNLIPGHGGILDRFDSEILLAPTVYFYLHFVVY